MGGFRGKLVVVVCIAAGLAGCASEPMTPEQRFDAWLTLLGQPLPSINDY